MANTIDLVAISNAEKEFSRALSHRDGLDWKESKVEFQAMHRELAVWFLLYDDINPLDSHKKFLEILGKYIGDFHGINITASFSLAREEKELIVGIFDGLDEILSHKAEKYFKKKRQSQIDIDETWVFSSKNSTR